MTSGPLPPDPGAPNPGGWGAAPNHPEGLPASPGGWPTGGAATQPPGWDSFKAITFAFHRLRDSSESALAIVLAQLLPVIPTMIAVGFTTYRMFKRLSASGFVPGAMQPRPEALDFAITQGATLLNMVLVSFFSGGVITIALRASRGEPTGFADILSGVRLFPRVLPVQLVTGSFFFAGGLINQSLLMAGVNQTLALTAIYGAMVPGLILMLLCSLAVPLIVDRDLGAVEAIRESFRLTQGHRINLGVMLLLIILVAMMGICACCVGVLVSWPLYAFSVAFAYLRITGQATREG